MTSLSAHRILKAYKKAFLARRRAVALRDRDCARAAAIPRGIHGVSGRLGRDPARADQDRQRRGPRLALDDGNAHGPGPEGRRVTRAAGLGAAARAATPKKARKAK